MGGEARAHWPAVAVGRKIIADEADQPAGIDGAKDLRRIPVLYPGERQLPAGSGGATTKRASIARARD